MQLAQPLKEPPSVSAGHRLLSRLYRLTPLTWQLLLQLLAMVVQCCDSKVLSLLLLCVSLLSLCDCYCSREANDPQTLLLFLYPCWMC